MKKALRKYFRCHFKTTFKMGNKHEGTFICLLNKGESQSFVASLGYTKHTIPTAGKK